MNALEIHNEAMKRAKQAAIDYMQKYGEPAFCGFAWVIIKNCHRSPQKKFVLDLSKIPSRPENPNGLKIAEPSYEGGYRISIPAYDINECGWRYQQSMDIKEAACEAYADYLREHGIEAYMRCRAD